LKIRVNDEAIDTNCYNAYHVRRFDLTVETIRRIGGGRTVELGGHPWAMTARLIAEPSVELVATVSAEEVSLWPDALPVTGRNYEIEVPGAKAQRFLNYSANVERTRFDINEAVDLVLACEIIEHLTRAPHVMLLNANAWLKLGGRMLVTTPNGAHFENPLRIKPKMPAYRASTYSRHNYVFTMDGLIDLIETCGFEIESAEFLSPYPRRGLSRLYPMIGRVPQDFLRQKFNQSLHVVARKVEALGAAKRLPKVYVPSSDWELVAGNSSAASLEEAFE
jgi:hypothetical protein